MIHACKTSTPTRTSKIRRNNPLSPYLNLITETRFSTVSYSSNLFYGFNLRRDTDSEILEDVVFRNLYASMYLCMESRRKLRSGKRGWMYHRWIGELGRAWLGAGIAWLIVIVIIWTAERREDGESCHLTVSLYHYPDGA